MNEAQFEADLDAYIASGEFTYLAQDERGRFTVAEAIARLRNEVRLRIEKFHGGASSISVFQIAAQKLAAAGYLRAIKFAPEPAVDSENLIAEKIAAFEAGKISTFEFRLACKQDRALRDAYEKFTGLAALGRSGAHA